MHSSRELRQRRWFGPIRRLTERWIRPRASGRTSLARYGARVGAALVLAGWPQAQAVETVRLPLIEAASREFPGDWACQDFWLRLPAHVSARSGSEAVVILHPSPELGRDLCSVALEVNGARLIAMNLAEPGTNRADAPAIELRAAVPERLLAAGWNQVGLRFVLRQDAAFDPAAQDRMRWTMRRAESHLFLAFERLPLFPELGRFPESLIEEQLLHPAGDGDDSPGLVVLLPKQRRDVHLRACAILGARLGQPGYGGHARLGLIDDWREETTNCNVIVVGLSYGLESLPVPAPLAARLGGLTAGQGMLAEFIAGPTHQPRRWLLVTGADEPGLENAVLTLGSAEALAELPPHPAIIARRPELPAGEAEERPPGPAVIPLQNLRRDPIELRGRYRSEQIVSGWRLSPGQRLESDGALNLQFSHAPFLVGPRSFLEVLLNGIRLGTVALTPDNALAGEAELPVPKGVIGQDPMSLAFRAHLDPGRAGCAEPPGEEAWVRIDGGSSLEITPGPVPMRDFQEIDHVLTRDRRLMRAAFAVPASATLTELGALFQLAVSLGARLPSSPVLWPEVTCYSPVMRPAADRLAGRAVLVLGSVPQWRQALPNGGRLALAASPTDGDTIRIQGRDHRVEQFEPGLLWAQMLPSPWTSNEVLVAAGGWQTFALPALARLVADPAGHPPILGDLCAIDAQGRTAFYDSRRILPESFADRIRRHIPRGLSVEATRARLAEATANGHRANGWSWRILLIAGSLLLLLVAARLVLQWDRVLRQRRAFEEEPSWRSAR